MLHLLPALILLLVNGQLASPSDVAALMQTQRVFVALALRPDGELEAPCRPTLRLAIRVLAHAGRWQSNAPVEDWQLEIDDNPAFPDWIVEPLSGGFSRGVRSRDGPIA